MTAKEKRNARIAVAAIAIAAAATGTILAIRHHHKKQLALLPPAPGAAPATLPGAAPATLPGEQPGGGGSGKDKMVSTRPIGMDDEADLLSPAIIQENLRAIAAAYGLPIAKNVERIYRQETGLKSGQYKNSGSAGMAAFSQTYPYNWSSLKSFWDANPAYKPVGMIAYEIGRENGKLWRYLAFNNFGGFWSLAEVLKNRGNDPGRWASTDANSATATSYRNAINKITPRYV